MGNFEEGDKIIILPCPGEHPFHNLCIKSWLKINTTCPNCRHNLDEDEAGEQEDQNADPEDVLYEGDQDVE